VACSENSGFVRVAISDSAVGCRPVVKFSVFVSVGSGPWTGAGIHRFFEKFWRHKDNMKQVPYWGPTVLHWHVKLLPGAFCSFHAYWYTFLYIRDQFSNYAEDIGLRRAELVTRVLWIPGLVLWNLCTAVVASRVADMMQGPLTCVIGPGGGGLGICARKCYGATPAVSVPVSETRNWATCVFRSLRCLWMS
jgi:hypothetical protein